MKEEVGQYREEGPVVDRHLLYLAEMIERWLKRDANFGILITDEALVIRFCNGWIESRAVRLGKYPQGSPLLEVFPDLAERRLDRLYREALQGRTQIISERFHRYLLPFPADAADAARSLMLQSARIYPLTENGRIAGTLTVIEDVTSRVLQERELRETVRKQEELIEALKHAENWLYEMSVTDELTGLYNRRGFLTLAEQQLRIAERTKRGFVLLFADLDGLKRINDRLGHTQGDAALQDMAGILKKTFRESDISARMGGDEFAVLALEGRREDAETLAENLRREIALHNRSQSRPYVLSASVGTVFCDPGASNDLETLLGRVDRLMYEEKQKKHRTVSGIIRA
jgi:diguanylate cyclase (GGDEF)-like protein